VTTEEPQAALRPRKRLTSTATGQSIFIGLWILGTLVIVTVLAGAFLLGQSFSRDSAEDSEIALEEVPVPAVEFPILHGVPVEPGQWPWDELRGGECISGFAGAFAEEFTVVGCDVPHDAQLITAVLLSRRAEEPFPGLDDVVQVARETCEVTDRIDYTLATQYDDLIVDYSYPASEEQWAQGERGVYCFVLRSSGGTLQGDLVD
jgi:hypothetical protein